VLSKELFAHAGALPPRFTAKHVTSVKQFTRDDLRYLFSVAHDMRCAYLSHHTVSRLQCIDMYVCSTMVKRVGSWDLLKGKVLANVFYEPSTRTSSSFQVLCCVEKPISFYNQSLTGGYAAPRRVSDLS